MRYDLFRLVQVKGSPRFALTILGLTLGLGMWAWFEPAPAHAICITTDYIVTSTADDGSYGTLRGGIGATCINTIHFNLPNPSTIVLTDTLEDGRNQTIFGPITSSVTISGNNSVRVMQVDTDTTVSIWNLTIANGHSTNSVGGGAVLSYGNLTLVNGSIISNSDAALANYGVGTMTVRNSTVSNNGTPSEGGGIFNPSGNLLVVNTTFANNSATTEGGAIENFASMTVTGSTFYNNTAINGGAIDTSGGSIINSTFYSNTAVGGGYLEGGGALYNDIGYMSILNSTIYSNSAPTSGGGIFNNTGIIFITNTIIANNPPGGNCYKNVASTVDGGNNLEDSTTCGFGGGTGSNTNPRLGPLANNGGATKTMALLPGSPAIDAGNDTYCPSTDQRGAHRPIGPRCDIGAYEAGYLFLPLIMK